MKKIVLAGILLLSVIAGKAQENKANPEDVARINIATYVPQQIDKMPEGARSILSNKLSQIVTQNGIGGSGLNQRFIITANINILTKDLTATAPPMTALTLDVALYIGDGLDGIKFASTSVTAKGVGDNETKAYIAAIRTISTSNTAILSFLETAKSKIVEYYKNNCDFILKDAETLAAQTKYEEAIYRLTSVPTACKDCYDKAIAAIPPMFKKFIDIDCRAKLQEARNAWAAAPNADGAAAAAIPLGSINPDAACYKDVLALTQEIGKRVKEVNNREWDFKVKATTDMIKAYRDVGVAYGNGQPKSITYNVRGWW